MRKRNRRAKVKTESIATVQKGNARVPRATPTKNGTVVTHTETYGTNVTGSNAFEVFSTWALQPGISSYSRGSPLGQWLPQIAVNFDNYEIESLRFKFRTACSTLTTGLVVFGYEPNPDGVAPTTYQELRNMYSVDGSAHANLTFDVSSRVRKKLLIRKGGVISYPNYDAGKVYFATIGVTGDALVGFVDVEYRIRLTNPQSNLTGTDPLPINAVKPFPTQNFTITGAVGTSNCANDCDGLFNSLLGQSQTVVGANLSTQPIVSYSAQSLSFENGCRFYNGATASRRALRVGTVGRYKMVFSPAIGYEDLKMYAIGLFTCPSGQDAWARAESTVYADIEGNTVAKMPTMIYRHRGFTGVTTGDPNPGTDVWPVYEWDFDAPYAAGTLIAVRVGVLEYNAVSTTTANVVGYTGIGATNIRLEYLGAIPTGA